MLCDTSVLVTLPDREVRNGFGELAKYHFLGLDEDLGATTVEDPDLATKVAACVAIKAAVVAADERESGQRALLNYGHTLAHALEIEGAFDLRHGEAVAIGLVYAARLARAMDRIDDAGVARHEALVGSYGLPTTLPPGADVDRLVDLMGRDKKAVDGLTFVLDGPRGPEVVPGVDAALVATVLGEMP